MAQITPTSGAPPQSDLDRLKSTTGKTLDAEKARLRKTTREFESFFLYYMLKTMRETVTSGSAKENAPLGGSMGKDTYQQMFDMEISRNVVCGGNRSMSEMLYKSMEKIVTTQYNARQKESGSPDNLKNSELHPEPSPLPLHRPNLPLPLQKNIQLRSLPPAVHRPPISIASVPHVAAPKDAIQSHYGRIIDEAARANGLDSALISSVIRAESNGDPDAVSPKGAKGLMQLADSTASQLGLSDPFDPRANVLAGSKYLRAMLNRFGDLRLALAAYNAGPGTVERHGGVPPFQETHDYITRVTDYMQAAQKDEPAP
jgi:Rod binding domain-containing protein